MRTTSRRTSALPRRRALRPDPRAARRSRPESPCGSAGAGRARRCATGTPHIGMSSPRMAAALGQRDVQRRRGRDRVLEEQLVEIAHAEEQQRIRDACAFSAWYWAIIGLARAGSPRSRQFDVIAHQLKSGITITRSVEFRRPGAGGDGGTGLIEHDPKATRYLREHRARRMESRGAPGGHCSPAVRAICPGPIAPRLRRVLLGRGPSPSAQRRHHGDRQSSTGVLSRARPWSTTTAGSAPRWSRPRSCSSTSRSRRARRRRR